jgi:hypothetical protein
MVVFGSRRTFRMSKVRLLSLAAMLVAVAAIGISLNARQATAAQGPATGLAVRLVDNDAAHPVYARDADNPARHPFQATLCVSFGVSCGSTPSTAAVPETKRLVIEYVSGQCPPAGTGLPTGLSVTGALLSTVAGGVAATHLFAIVPGVSIGGPNGFVVAQTTRLYADPGTDIELDVDVGGLGIDGSIRCTLAVSGYLIAE